MVVKPRLLAVVAALASAVGYALRVLDEAAGQEPLMKADIARER